MARSIQEMFDKFKLFLQDDRFFYGAIIVLVAASSFGLGRLSAASIDATHTENKPIILQQAAATAVALPTSTPGAAAVFEEAPSMYVGSKNGTKYHLPWCGSASQIKEENKVYFSSKAEAEASGYTPAANCKGI